MAKSKDIPADHQFPQLREITDPDKLVPKLRQYMGPDFVAQGMQVESCSIDHLHYMPRGGCKLTMKVLISRANQPAEEQIYLGGISLHKRKRMKEIYEQAGQQALSQPKFGPPVIYIPEWELLLLAFPNDPNLPALSVMANPEKVLALVKAAPEKFGLSSDSPAPMTIEAKMTKYIPGHRCGHIYRFTFAGANGNDFKHAVFGKLYHDNEAVKIYEMMRQIWESEACKQGNLLMPQPYSFDAANNIVWQEAISGQPFAKIAATIPNLPEVANEIGMRLAALHNLRLDLPQEKTFSFQVTDVRHSVRAISQTFPEFGASCAAIGQKLLDAASRLGPGPLTPIHASFKFSHIFATEKGITFIDFDGANLGDPGYDLGRFISHLRKMEADGKIAPDAAEQTIRNFNESYNRAAISPIPQERIDWFAASHLVSSEVYKSVKRMDPELVGRLLEIADRLCPG